MSVFQCVMHCDAIFKWKNVESGVERRGGVTPNCKIKKMENNSHPNIDYTK